MLRAINHICQKASAVALSVAASLFLQGTAAHASTVDFSSCLELQIEVSTLSFLEVKERLLSLNYETGLKRCLPNDAG